MHDLSIAYLAALAGLCVHMFFGETLEAFRILGPLWFMTGLIFAANNITDRPRQSGETAFQST